MVGGGGEFKCGLNITIRVDDSFAEKYTFLGGDDGCEM